MNIMRNDEAKESLEKIDLMLQQIKKARNELIEFFGPQIVLAAETLANFDQIEDDMKQLRGQVMEFVL